MVQPGSLILVHMLDPQEVGSYFDRARWPLHITLLQWFEATQAQHAPLRQQLANIAQVAPPVRVTVGDQMLFGPSKDLPVNVIANQDALRPLHVALLSLAHLLQLPIIDEQWVGENYAAHITQQHGDRHANQGDIITVDDFYLVQLIDEHRCQITAHFQLRGSDV